MGVPRGRRIGRCAAWGIYFALAGTILAACSIGGIDGRQIDPKDSHPPDVMDHVRSLDLLPRFPKNGDSAPTPNAANASRPAVFAGAGQATVAQPAERDTAPNGDGYDLNFENAPVATVAKVILGDILGVGYTIDPRVQGTVTLASGRPVAKSDTLFVLENALRLSNVALVRDSTGYRLMPAGDAVGAGPMDRLASAQPGYGITVVPLRYVAAQTIVKLIDGFAAKPGQIRADAARNLLILQGSGAERRNALEIVGSFDVDWMRGQSVGVFPVHNSTPEPLIAELEKIMDSGDAGLGQGVIKFQPIARMNAILVVSRKPEFLRAAGTWISRLDQSDTASTNLRVYWLHSWRSWPRRRAAQRDLPRPLRERAQFRERADRARCRAHDLVLDVRTAERPERPAAELDRRELDDDHDHDGRHAEHARRAQLGSRATQQRPVRRRQRERPGRKFSGVLPGVRITADVTNNSILVYANRDAQKIVEQTLRQIDRPLLQVAIDATIAEVTLNDQLTYGVQFFLQDNPDRGSIINSIGGAVLAEQLPGFNFLVGSAAAPHVILNALHNVTDVRVLSNPSLVVLDNQVATLQVGDQVPISTGTATVLTANNTVVNTIDYKNTGIILRVVPRINPNGNVVLDIEQEISNVQPGTPATALTPTVSERKVKSSIAVQSGQTVLLAGLISDSVNVTKQGIPLLDQIPKIGDVFANQTKTNIRTELIIFIRPQIIRDAVDANMVAEELRTKMNDRLLGSNNHMPAHGTVEGPTPPFFH